jgi:hypothetical protein
VLTSTFISWTNYLLYKGGGKSERSPRSVASRDEAACRSECEESLPCSLLASSCLLQMLSREPSLFGNVFWTLEILMYWYHENPAADLRHQHSLPEQRQQGDCRQLPMHLPVLLLQNYRVRRLAAMATGTTAPILPVPLAASTC